MAFFVADASVSFLDESEGRIARHATCGRKDLILWTIFCLCGHAYSSYAHVPFFTVFFTFTCVCVPRCPVRAEHTFSVLYQWSYQGILAAHALSVSKYRLLRIQACTRHANSANVAGFWALLNACFTVPIDTSVTRLVADSAATCSHI